MEVTLNSIELETLANRFRVLADPTGLHQGNVSKHLRLMKDAGVVTCRRDSVWRYYRVIDTDLLAFCKFAKKSTNNY